VEQTDAMQVFNRKYVIPNPSSGNSPAKNKPADKKAQQSGATSAGKRQTVKSQTAQATPDHDDVNAPQQGEGKGKALVGYKDALEAWLRETISTLQNFKTASDPPPIPCNAQAHRRAYFSMRIF